MRSSPRSPLVAPGFWWMLSLAIASADLALKSAITGSLPVGTVIPLTPFFNLVHFWNTGAAFSFLADAGDRQGHFRPSALQLSEQEATITQNPLLQVAEGMFDDGAAPDHHLWMHLHPLMHALECGLMDMPSHVSTFSLGAA